MDFVPYFQPWFKLCYYVFFVPFKVQKDGKNYTLSTNLMQQILCGFIHTLISIFSVFEINGVIAGRSQKNDPALFLRLIERVNSALFCYIFFYKVWRKRELVLSIFGQHVKNEPKQTMYWPTILTWFIFTFGIFAFSSWLMAFDWENPDFEKALRGEIKRVFYEYFQIPTSGMHPDNGQPFKISMCLRIVTTASIIIRLYKWVLIDLLICFIIISSCIGLIIGTEFEQLLLQCSPASDVAESIVFEFYHRLKELLDKLNDYLGLIWIVMFGSSTTFCAVSVIDILDSKTLNFPIIMLTYFGLEFSAFTIAAETHYKVSRCDDVLKSVQCDQISYFKAWLLNRPKKSATTVTEYLAVENCNLALRGGRLFTITYSFLGSATSVVITYAIIMIQFRATMGDRPHSPGYGMYATSPVREIGPSPSPQ